MADDRHQRSHFYKYATAQTTIRILETGRIRYSSPLLFNDPFDVQAGLHLAFDQSTLPERIHARIVGLVMSEEEPQIPKTSPLAGAVAAMRRARREGWFSPDTLRRLMEPELSTLPATVTRMRDHFQGEVWQSQLQRLRLLCVSEDNDNLLMWAHYTQNHEGAVLKLRVLPERDNALCVAQPVIYTSTPAAFLAEETLFGSLFGLGAWDDEAILPPRYICTKSDSWSYEKEWRVWYPEPKVTTPLFTDMRLEPEEVGAVYLGCRIEASHRDSIRALLTRSYPHAELYQGGKVGDAFALEFSSLSGVGEQKKE